MLKSEFAPAKINLTLEVLGTPRPTAITSFAVWWHSRSDAGDRLTLSPEPILRNRNRGAIRERDRATPISSTRRSAAVSAAVPDLNAERSDA